MTTPTVRGTFTSLIKQWQSELVTNNQDKSEYQVAWKIHKNYWQAEAPEIGDESADFAGLYLDERRVKIEGVVAEIVGTYRGQVGITFDQVPAPEYSLSVDGIQNPIQQHPDWEDNSVFPLADKIFDPEGDPTGKFVAFKNSSQFRGFKTYLVAGARWVEKRYSRTRPGEEEIYLIGKRMAPSGLENATPGHWLFSSCNFDQSGGFWIIVRQWTYSGPDLPWNSNIYGE